MKTLCTLLLVFAAIAGPTRGQTGADSALAALKAGNALFAEGHSVTRPMGSGTRSTLALGQHPSAIVLCCADSRVPPEHIFNAGIGELFVVRLAGNVVDEETLASIEYAAEHLHTQLCIVLGHENCGAIAACAGTVQAKISGAPDAAESPSLHHLLQQLEPALRSALRQNLAGNALCDRAAAVNAQCMARMVLRRSPLLQSLQQRGTFCCLPARYQQETGLVEWLPEGELKEQPMPVPLPQALAKAMAPHVALQMLQAGHRRYLGEGPPRGDISPLRRAALTHGQQPLAIVLTCADSRVAPEHIFDAGLGELFVVRVAGNVINEDVLASLEYAALHTGAPLIVIMGHSGCGAVKAAIDQHATESLSENLNALLQRLAPAVKAARQQTNAPEQLLVQAVRANVLQSCGLARKQSELLRHLEAQGYLSIVPAIYQLQSGDIEWLPDATRPLQQAVAAPSGESAQKPDGTPETDHAMHAAAPIKLANAEHSNETATTKNPKLDWAQESNLPNTQLQTDNAPHANSLLAALDDQRGYWFAGLGFSSALLGAWLLIRKKSA